MTTLTIDLPDNIAKEAQDAGLLTPEALAELITDAVRRQAGQRLLDIAQRLHSANIPPMSDEEVVAEVKAVRAERRARQNKADHAGRS